MGTKLICYSGSWLIVNLETFISFKLTSNLYAHFSNCFLLQKQAKDFYLNKSNRSKINRNEIYIFSSLFKIDSLETFYKSNDSNRRKIVRHIYTLHIYLGVYLSFSLYLSSYLSLRSDINCLLPNLIRNFRRRDNLTSFLFSLTRSPSLLYRGLVPRIFLSTSEWANERASECSAHGHVRLYLFNLYRCVVRTYTRVLPLVPRLADGRGEKKCAKLTDEEQRWEESECPRVSVILPSVCRFKLESKRKQHGIYTTIRERLPLSRWWNASGIIYLS